MLVCYLHNAEAQNCNGNNWYNTNDYSYMFYQPQPPVLNYQFNNRAIYFAAFLLVITDVLIYVTGERSAIFLLTFSTVFIILLISKYKKYEIIRNITIETII